MTNSDQTSDRPDDQTTLPITGGINPPPAIDEPTRLFEALRSQFPVSSLDKEFDGYELIAELGRGGMGVVYRARQKKLNREVALKMILGGRMASQDDLERFLIEARAAARLHHRHIVTVHEIGEVNGQHYFSMEYIQGETLAKRLAGGPMPSRNAARIMVTVAQALHYAHQQGILHRDLKPSNILMDAKDDPYVTDFGLAKRLGGDATHKTQTGAVLGTPSYMSPEQAAGKIKELGVTCDVYGMGAVLYEMLTGKPPFRSETHLDTLMHVMYSEPVPPRLLNPKVDTDLETICLKCLEKDPKNRYQSAEDLARDLQRYLNGESISARSFNVIDRISRILDRSQHDAAFHTWSSMLFMIAAVIFFEHLAIFLLAWTDQPSYLFLLARISQFVVLGFIFWANRGDSIFPRTSAERELWTIWIGYIISYGAAQIVVRGLINSGILDNGQHSPHQWENLIIYPISSVLSGLAFFVMGSNYWGRCYAIGLAFMGLAMLSTTHLIWAPLEFGVLWAVSLCSLGYRMYSLSTKNEEDRKNFYTEDTLTANQKAPVITQNHSAPRK